MSGVLGIASHSVLQNVADVVTRERPECAHFSAFADPISDTFGSSADDLRRHISRQRKVVLYKKEHIAILVAHSQPQRVANCVLSVSLPNIRARVMKVTRNGR